MTFWDFANQHADGTLGVAGLTVILVAITAWVYIANKFPSR